MARLVCRLYGFLYPRQAQRQLRDSSGRDENLADIPPLNMRLHLGYYLTPELSLSWRGSWYDAQQKVPDEGLFVSDRPSQAYFLQDLYLAFQPEDMLQGLELRLALRNLTNQYYSPHLPMALRLRDGIFASVWRTSLIKPQLFCAFVSCKPDQALILRHNVRFA